jgi:hypothetical protein
MTQSSNTGQGRAKQDLSAAVKYIETCVHLKWHSILTWQGAEVKLDTSHYTWYIYIYI